jgi:hypothetical protein
MNCLKIGVENNVLYRSNFEQWTEISGSIKKIHDKNIHFIQNLPAMSASRKETSHLRLPPPYIWHIKLKLKKIAMSNDNKK